MEKLIELIQDEIKEFENFFRSELSTEHKAKVIEAVLSQVRENIHDWTLEAIESSM